MSDNVGYTVFVPLKDMTAAQLAAAIRWDERGLVPAIVQDAATKQVLMMAYMNEESLRLTFEKGETVFWSRSRGELWHKGATSGNTQRVVAFSVDCDGDTVLLEVEPNGPACHTGETSCFYRRTGAGEPAAGAAGNRFAIIEALERTIAQREVERPEGAYTTYLFEKGVDKILKKVGEEAAEVIIAAKNRSAEELRYETSDLLFHLLVLLQEQKLPLDEVLGELARRHQPK
ncbi:bifunctional phosphoribosyl-AMP cyclohydrolase/phosphoribosyl-ATP diphosphatase HisIE [Paenibacillus sp.]|uniref:bifunctional phosphoribosyl-AMP cyclohydrolase/phosphoribosyl-ATP diphosphatase HisIE n=1 Tax=Paenibacillus sp. TaxID=58172 RepID=UPI002D640D2C|nr:bifunctional phosphoribosyl-AMP cyclohydrolase/phosphoribosyl-ATP diphosphatase HisIE [Paenibacillus sp.]HZG86940.1 bifunctional phosphoribosyl-AMP cyclohydrolase/phosphoribosyl-ATP diphosphatase HisIE [Paenibacillus sp.]